MSKVSRTKFIKLPRPARWWRDLPHTHRSCDSAHLHKNVPLFIQTHTHTSQSPLWHAKRRYCGVGCDIEHGTSQGHCQRTGQLVQQYHLVHSHTAQQPAPEHGRDNCGRQHISVVLAPDPWDLGLLPVSVSSVPRWHKDKMLFEHAPYPVVSLLLGAPEFYNVCCVLGAQHLGFAVGKVLTSVSISVALQNHFLGKLAVAHFSRQVILVHHKHVDGAHLRHPICALGLHILAAGRPGAADARSLRAGQHQIVAEAGVLAVRTCHHGVRQGRSLLMLLLLRPAAFAPTLRLIPACKALINWFMLPKCCDPLIRVKPERRTWICGRVRRRILRHTMSTRHTPPLQALRFSHSVPARTW